MPCSNRKPVVDAIDVLDGKAFLGDNVLIVGGGMVGLETAEHVISQNRRATIIEMQAQVGSDLNPNIKYFLLKTLQEAGVEILTDTRVENITERTVACVNLQGAIDLEGFDTIVWQSVRVIQSLRGLERQGGSSRNWRCKTGTQSDSCYRGRRKTGA